MWILSAIKCHTTPQSWTVAERVPHHAEAGGRTTNHSITLSLVTLYQHARRLSSRRLPQSWFRIYLVAAKGTSCRESAPRGTPLGHQSSVVGHIGLVRQQSTLHTFRQVRYTDLYGAGSLAHRMRQGAVAKSLHISENGLHSWPARRRLAGKRTGRGAGVGQNASFCSDSVLYVRAVGIRCTPRHRDARTRGMITIAAQDPSEDLSTPGPATRRGSEQIISTGRSGVGSGLFLQTNPLLNRG